MGRQRSIWVSGLIIRVMALKSRAIYQYGVGGGGGVVDKKKGSATPPVNCRCRWCELFFYSLNLKNIVKYCI